MPDNGLSKHTNMIADLVKIAENFNFFPKTIIYNESWLIRILLFLLKNDENFRKLNASFLPFPENAEIYSEAQLPTPFKRRAKKDNTAENNTRVDGIVGDFSFKNKTKTGIKLNENLAYLTVFEAKLFSNLSKGTTNAKKMWNQISRIVSCMIYSTIISQNELEKLPQLNLVLIFPEEKQIKSENYQNTIKKEINERIRFYKSGGALHQGFLGFETNWENVFDNNVKIYFQTWENFILDSKNNDLKNFYNKCLEYNRPM